MKLEVDVVDSSDNTTMISNLAIGEVFIDLMTSETSMYLGYDGGLYNYIILGQPAELAYEKEDFLVKNVKSASLKIVR